MVPVLTPDHSSSRCDQECGDRIRTRTEDAQVIEIFSRSEEDGGKPVRHGYRVIDNSSDGQSFPGHNGINSLFFDHSFCFLSHWFVLQQIFHIRDKPKVSSERYRERIHMAGVGGLKDRIACHSLMVNQKDWRRSMNSFNFFFPSSSISINSIPAS
jgi:hypothetical protein